MMLRTLAFFAVSLLCSAEPAPIPGSLETIGAQRDKMLARVFSRTGTKYAGAGKYRVIIAAVPDPARSRLGLETHRTLESIAQAVGDKGYLYRGVQLAWVMEEDVARPRKPEPGAEELADIGVMLFEGQGAERSLVVLLIGETPAAGLDEDALSRALELRKHLQGGGEFLFFGPTFSGSYSQIASLLGAAAQEGEKGFVVSGMATSPLERKKAGNAVKAYQWLTFAGDHDLSVRAINAFAGCGDPEKQQGQDTGSSNKGKGGEAAKTTQENKEPCREIAYLTESQTLFGEDAARDTLHLFYPRGISRLRPRSSSMFASKWFRRAPAEGQPGGVAADLSAGSTAEDMLPPVAGKQEEDGLVAQLYTISARLRQLRVPNVAVIATDIYDTLFLVRFLRQETPNVRIFLLDTDTLLLTEVLEYPVEGTVSVSRYRVPAPFGQNGGPMALFPSHYAVGQYCAARFLADPKRDAQNNEPCGPPEWQGVWLQAVSRAGFLPVKLHMAGEAEKQRPKDGGGVNPTVTDLWAVLALAVYAWALLHCQSVESLRRQFHYRWKWPFDRTWLKPYRVWLDGEPGVRESATRLLGAAGTLVFMALVFVTWPVARRWSWDLWAMFALIGMLLQLTVMVGIYQLAGALKGWQRHALRALPVVAGLCLAAALMAEGDSRPYTLARLAMPSSGVSLTAPFLAILMLLYQHVFASLRREQFHVRRPEIPKFSFLSHRGRWWVVENLDRHPKSTMWWGLLFGAGGVAVGTVMHVVPGSGARQLLEGPGFEWLSVLLLGLGLGQLVLGVFRFGVLWFLLRRFLDMLEQSRLRQACTRLPKVYSWSPVWAAGGLRQTVLVWTRTLEVGQCLQMTKPDDLPADQRLKVEEATALMKRQTVLLAEYDPKAPDQRDLNKRLREWQEEIDVLLDPVLQASWKSQTFSDSAEEQRQHLRPLTAFEFYLEEYCAMRCVAVVRQAMLHLRSALGVLSVTAALLLAAFSLYAFRSRETLDLTLIPGMAVAGFYVMMVLYQMERNPLLNRLSNEKPGEVNRMNLLIRSVKYLGAPALLLLLSQFPELNRLVLRWFAPMLSDLR